MGIRIHRNTWSSPLQLIDSWLPSNRQPPPNIGLSQVASRFIRAGWLQRGACNDATAYPTACTAESAVRPERLRRAIRVTPQVSRTGPSDSRVCLSGRLVDVCAELERLVARDTVRTGEQD